MKIGIFGFGANAAELMRRLAGSPDWTVAVAVPRRKASAIIANDLEVFPAQARDLGIPVLETADINEAGFVERIRDLGCDLLVNMGHHQRFRRPLLDAARLGVVNIHPGLLPLGRGSGAVYGEIVNGRSEIGQSIHFMSEDFDTGRVVHQRSFPVRGDEYLDEIETLVRGNIVDFFLEGLEKVRLGAVGEPVLGFGTYYPRKPDGDEIVDWTQSSDLLLRKIRMRSPRLPGVAFLDKDWRRVDIWRVEPAEDLVPFLGSVGQVIDRSPRGILVKTADTAIWVTEIGDKDCAHTIPSFPIGTCFVTNWLHEAFRLRTELDQLHGRLAALEARMDGGK